MLAFVKVGAHIQFQKSIFPKKKANTPLENIYFFISANIYVFGAFFLLNDLY